MPSRTTFSRENKILTVSSTGPAHRGLPGAAGAGSRNLIQGESHGDYRTYRTDAAGAQREQGRRRWRGGGGMPDRSALLIVWPNALEAQGLANHLAKIGVQCEIRDYGDVRAEDAGRDRLVAQGVIPQECLEALRCYAECPSVDAAARRTGVGHRTLERRVATAQELLGCATPREAVLAASRMGLL